MDTGISNANTDMIKEKTAQIANIGSPAGGVLNE